MLTALYNSPPSVNPIPALQPAAWFRGGYGVTGSLTASNWADQSGNGRDLAQVTAGNQPIYLPYSGTAYGYLPGVATNYFSTPDSTAASITGDLDIRAYAALDDWTPADATAFICKTFSGAGNYSYYFYLSTGGNLQLGVSLDGSAVEQPASSVAVGLAAGAAKWVRATRVASTGAVNFYTSDDGSSWTVLGTEQSTASGSLFDGNSAVTVGQLFGDLWMLGGKVYRAQIYNGIDGTLAVDFNPSTFAETSTNGATAVASTGETWTLNSTGTLPARIAKSPMFLGEGTARKMATANFTLDQPVEHFIVAQPITWTAADYMLSGTVAEAGLTQVTATPQIGLNAGSAAAANGSFALGAFAIVHTAINGDSSSVTVNNGTAATGNAGANNPGGIALFSNQAGTGYFNGAVKELVTFGALSAADRVRIFNWLNSVHHVY